MPANFVSTFFKHKVFRIGKTSESGFCGYYQIGKVQKKEDFEKHLLSEIEVKYLLCTYFLIKLNIFPPSFGKVGAIHIFICISTRQISRDSVTAFSLKVQQNRSFESLTLSLIEVWLTKMAWTNTPQSWPIFWVNGINFSLFRSRNKKDFTLFSFVWQVN